ncbi:MAG: class I SAM-dependent methyltransferase, partial [Acidimicrobiia bacterium]|nr:class I SAM-dependent methyltransferase [Acidimicrobiia bacterium]
WRHVTIARILCVMHPDLDQRLDASGYTSPGFPERYDKYRPRPPVALLDYLGRLIPDLKTVVDLGSGTGLSTRAWAERARQVIGIEPNDVMRGYAEQATPHPNVRYVGRSAFDTGLSKGSADLVTAAQSLQWMEPEWVFPEISRLLRPGGVFCAYQYVGLSTSVWDVGVMWQRARQRRSDLLRKYGLLESQPRWPVSLERLNDSGVFSSATELAAHSIEQGNGDRLLGFALSEGWITTLLAEGASEEEIGLDAIRQAAVAMPEPVPWWISYRVWMGVK